jgi:TIR domain
MPTTSQVAVVSSPVDSVFARQVIADLRDVGLDAIEAPLALGEPGPDGGDAPPLPAVDIFLVVLSPEGLRSAWLLRAVAQIRALLGTAATRRIIPVRMGAVALPADLADHVTVDFFDRPREQAVLSLEFVINTVLYEFDASAGINVADPFSPEKVKELEERFGTLDDEHAASLPPVSESAGEHEEAGEERARGITGVRRGDEPAAPPPPPAWRWSQEDLLVETERVGGMLPPKEEVPAPPVQEQPGAPTLDDRSGGGAERSPWQPVPPGSAPVLEPAGLPPDLAGMPAAAPPVPPQAVPPAAQPPGYGASGDTGSYGDLGQSRFLRTDPEAVAIRSTEQVTFTAYHPREIEPREWQQMLLYIALDTPRTLAGVAADAEERLGNRKSDFRAAPAPTAAAIKRGTRLAIVPLLDGFTFNPPSLRVTWEEDMQRHDFRLRATSAAPGRAANGSIQIYRGVLLLAEVPISVYVRHAGERADIPSTFASIVARAYRRIFASYSHGDTVVVRSCESAAEALGDRYLRDVTLLRSGQQWDERLLRAIGEADIFQLFWSEKAARSLAVEKEWRHALELARREFIRPVYWTRQPYAIPPELASIHFDRLDLARLGLTGAKMLTFRLFGRG